MQRDVTIADLSNMRQRPNETVDAYIGRWQKEANRCRTHLPEAEQVQLCRNGIRDDIALVLSEQIASFTLLAKEAHNKERVLAQRDERMKKEGGAPPKPHKKSKGGNSANVAEVKKESKPSGSGGGNKSQTPQQANQQEPNYPFSDDEVLPILMELLTDPPTIKLPEPKYLDEVGKVDDPNYGHYHRGIHHPTSKCWTLKKIIMRCMEKGLADRESVQSPPGLPLLVTAKSS